MPAKKTAAKKTAVPVKPAQVKDDVTAAIEVLADANATEAEIAAALVLLEAPAALPQPRVPPRQLKKSMSNPTKVFEDMNARITQETARTVNSTYLFDIGGDEGGKWFADLTRSEGPYIEQKDGKAKCTITVRKSEDWVAIASGEMNPTSAFMQGKMKVKGDMAVAMRLQTLLSFHVSDAMEVLTATEEPVAPTLAEVIAAIELSDRDEDDLTVAQLEHTIAVLKGTSEALMQEAYDAMEARDAME